MDNNIRCITSDSSSILWVGTDYGLYNYDGGSWNTFTMSNSGLPDNQIRSLYVDDTGYLWIGTFNGGLVQYNGSVWNVWNTFNSNIPDDYIKSVYADDTGHIWLGTSFGLVKKDSNDVWPIWNALNSDMWSNNVTDAKVKDSVVFFGSFNGGLSLLRDTTITVYNSYLTSFPDNTVLSLDIKQNEVWCATPSAGIAVYYGPGLFQYYQSESSLLPTNSLTYVHVGDHDTYFGSYDKGVIFFSNGQFTYFDSTNSAIPDNYVQCVYEFGDVLWVGTNSGGLAKFELFSGVEEPLITDKVSYTIHNDHILLSDDHYNRYRLYNTSGQMVRKGSVNNTEIYIGDLNSAVYIVEVHSKDDGHYHAFSFVKP